MRSLSIVLAFGLLFVTFSTQLFANNYTVAVRAHSGIVEAKVKWQATIDYLNKKIPEHRFRLMPIVSLNEIADRAGKGGFDFLLTNPSSYVEVNVRYGANLLATLNNDRSGTEQSSFGSVIFTHASNTEIVNISNLENKDLMVVSEPAFGGWRVAWLEMLERGFDPHKRLKSLIVSKNGTQPEVVLAVRNRLVDAGIVRTDLLERMEKKGQIDMRYLRIINNKNVDGFPFFLSTKLYPEWAFLSLSKVPRNDGERVKSVLLSIARESQAALRGKYIGWIKPLDYRSVEKLMKRLRVGPYSKSRHR